MPMKWAPHGGMWELKKSQGFAELANLFRGIHAMQSFGESIGLRSHQHRIQLIFTELSKNVMPMHRIQLIITELRKKAMPICISHCSL